MVRGSCGSDRQTLETTFSVRQPVSYSGDVRCEGNACRSYNFGGYASRVSERGIDWNICYPPVFPADAHCTHM